MGAIARAWFDEALREGAWDRAMSPGLRRRDFADEI
jgi:hypothetical protein